MVLLMLIPFEFFDLNENNLVIGLAVPATFRCFIVIGRVELCFPLIVQRRECPIFASCHTVFPCSILVAKTAPLCCRCPARWLGFGFTWTFSCLDRRFGFPATRTSIRHKITVMMRNSGGFNHVVPKKAPKSLPQTHLFFCVHDRSFYEGREIAPFYCVGPAHGWAGRIWAISVQSVAVSRRPFETVRNDLVI